ncbi:oxidoreductase [Paenibacillus sp. NFR01]|uniref:oxidoreductase n=1 Tax=Paenibacillus sp. NFR01 TaxID=1566279 RepID=UPI0008C78CA2|nr:oxidoreductase [Paenibacillus sp. NFR01]SET21968.1 scyllo-inositol 2-dehydrogenase (NADP+) [Paenibacillus sp. NFR01]
MKIVNVGMVGYGFSGEIFHAPVIQTIEGLNLCSIVSSNPLKVEEKLPGVAVVSSLGELLADNNIELVIITSPNATHYDYARQSLLAGKHVVVEKPFVITSEEGRKLIELAERTGKSLSVFHNRRWDNDFLTLQDIISFGALGEIRHYETHFDRFRPEVKTRWREQDAPGAGFLYDLGSHLIDQAVTLFGKPDTVYGDVGIQREGSVTDDYFHLILTYGPLRVILHSGSLVVKPGPRVLVHGTKGSFVKVGVDPQEEQLRSGSRPGDTGWGEDKEEQFAELTIQREEGPVSTRVKTLPGAYERYYQGIYESITENAPLPVRPEDALNTIKIIELAKRSSLEQRTLPFA